MNTRLIAQKMWGECNAAYRTNTKNAYYYSCAGHGGYIVKAEALTEEQKENISKFEKPLRIQELTDDNGKVWGTNYNDIPSSCRSQTRFKAPPNAKWIDKWFYVFEEDCAWAILEKFTNIRLKNSITTDDIIEKTFNQWYKEKK
jgi:hypothetical protein